MLCGSAASLCCSGSCAGCRPGAEALNAPGQDPCGRVGVVQGALVGGLLEELLRIVACCLGIGEGGRECGKGGVFDDLLGMVGHGLG